MFKNCHFVCLFNLLADVKKSPSARQILSLFATERFCDRLTSPKVTKGLFSLGGIEILYIKELKKKILHDRTIFTTF